jgi:proline iminopeptidase
MGMVEIGDICLHVDLLGHESSPVLLYLHGGPGAGAYDFVLYQGELLARHLRVVAFDQRGVLRSEPLAVSKPFGLRDLIDDCEALRLRLGIERWSVLGHSFGGYLGVLYATTYPASVSRLVLENPTFDLGNSARSLLRSAAQEFVVMGKEEIARQCRDVACGDQEAGETWQTFMDLGRELGVNRDNLYVHGPDKAFFERLALNAPFPLELWGRAKAFQERLYTEGRIFDSVVPLLSQIVQPSLLIKGKHDIVTSEEQLAAFRENVPHGRVALLAHSGHFARVEEPGEFAQLVTSFVIGDPH